jgi:hypothetical protein
VAYFFQLGSAEGFYQAIQDALGGRGGEGRAERARKRADQYRWEHRIKDYRAAYEQVWQRKGDG